MKQNIFSILTFFLLAFAFSWLVNQFVQPLTVGYLDVKTILTGLGPALSGLFCYSLFKTPNSCRISLGGTKPLVSYGIALVAIVLPLLMSSKASISMFIGVIVTQFVYTLGEEFGWRHYLQNATSDFGKWGQAAVIGGLWFLWHYSILADPTTMLTGQAIPFYIGIPGLLILLILLSQLFGSMVIRTQALLLPTLIHYVGKVGPGSVVLIIIGLVVIAYLFWQKLSVKSEPATV